MKKIFVQIGAGAGDLDPSTDFIEGFSGLVKSLDKNSIDKILLVEPNPVNIPTLKECWKDYPQAEIYNIGIVPSSFENKLVTFYYCITDGPHFQCTSVNKDHTSRADLEEFQAPCETLTEFLTRTIDKTNVDMLALDIEGIDGEVLLDTDFSKFNIDKISFEHTKTSGAVIQHLETYGYEYAGLGLDRNGLDSLYQKKKDTHD